MTNEVDAIFRVLEEEIREAGEQDLAVPDIYHLTMPDLSETTREAIREYLKGYHGWMELAAELAHDDFTSEEDMAARLVAIRGIVRVAQYYIERLQAAVGRDRDVPWETRVAMDLMLSAFGEQLGA